MGKELDGLLDLVETNDIKLITSYEQIGEIIDVVDRPGVDKYIKDKERKKLLLRFLKRKAEIISIKNKINDCRDKKDNFILEMGIVGKVKYIVTGDMDLLELNPYRKIKIIKYSMFKEIL
jgi:putative PIN family toxin of toxin-antitoxin system